MIKRLKDNERGKVFMFAGHKWIILEHGNETTLVLMEGVLERRAFDHENSADWRQSSLRDYLNGRMYEQLTKATHNALVDNIVCCRN